MRSETVLMTYSSDSSTLRTVSFSPSSLSCATKPSSDGVTEMTTYWLNGAALSTPSPLSDVTRAIGRGITVPIRNL